ncbi:biopolymer transporter ExbD [Roseovarius sp. EL26]|uniref:ExbD/TolR family protein n=1 Tax=Roseovarius sp. EL26 TaxID=2126672 RepID=UPI000EA1A56B|nr:biopolymer transporter ExbD [Roseovarius sp. EL26]
MRRRLQRRRLSLTSLIDVIFLLLLFFMLTSTFSKFSEVDLTTATSGVNTLSKHRPIFLKLGQDALSLNGHVATLNALPEALAAQRTDSTKTTLVVSLSEQVPAQRLVDLLVVLRGITDLNYTVLGGV